MFGLDYEQGGPAQQWASQQGFDHGVTFVGALPYQELLKRVAAEVDVIVHPSLDESFSMAAIEAMALKKPVIAGKSTPGVREVLGFGKYGILVNVNNSTEIANAMLKLARDVDYRGDVAKSGYERASTRYRLKTVMAQYEALYTNVQQVS
jgi:glycosyltransferase involved in cell wall biosynthesis